MSKGENKRAAVKVLFVCTGNICRSPTAEGVFRARVEAEGLGEKITTDSAGTHGYHIGDPPDPRSIAAAKKRGLDLSTQRARRITRADFTQCDVIVAMDAGHLAELQALKPPGTRADLRLFLGAADVPDPYTGNPAGFDHVLDLIEDGAIPLLAEIRTRYI